MKLRTVASSAIWGRRSRFRCREIMFSMLCHGHTTDPVWAVAYDAFLVCGRVLHRQPELVPLFGRVWQLRVGTRANLVGPVGNLCNAAKQLGFSWSAPCVLTARIWDRRQLNFLYLDAREFAHELREGARHLFWSRAGYRRADLQGLEMGVDVEATTQLLRASGHSHVHKGLLRSILSGGVVCGQRAKKAGFTDQDTCAFCSCRQAESVHHMFWECPAWAHVRAQHQLAATSFRSDWPACLSCCGVLCDGALLPPPPPPIRDPTIVQTQSKPVTLHLDECFIAGRV